MPTLAESRINAFEIKKVGNLNDITKKLKTLTAHLDLLQVVKSRQNFFGKLEIEPSIRVYTDAEVESLKKMVGRLVAYLDESFANNNVITNNQFCCNEACLVLEQVYNALLNPCRKNIQCLKNSAKEVTGRGNLGARIGVILLAIAGFLCGILPGLVFAIGFAPGLLAKNSRQGLSQLAFDASHVIAAKAYRDESSRCFLNVSTDSFFQQKETRKFASGLNAEPFEQSPFSLE